MLAVICKSRSDRYGGRSTCWQSRGGCASRWVSLLHCSIIGLSPEFWGPMLVQTNQLRPCMGWRSWPSNLPSSAGLLSCTCRGSQSCCSRLHRSECGFQLVGEQESCRSSAASKVQRLKKCSALTQVTKFCQLVRSRLVSGPRSSWGTAKMLDTSLQSYWRCRGTLC